MNIVINERGSILITTLWIMAILTLLAMGIGFRASLEVRLAKYSVDRLEARYLAKAGVVKARQLLADDKKSYDTLYECGIALEEEMRPEALFGAEWNKLGTGNFSVHYAVTREPAAEEEEEEYEEYGPLGGIRKVYGMMDEERKININMRKLTRTRKTTLQTRREYRAILGRLLPEPDGEEALTKDELIDGIIDWQDADPIGNAENSYYEGLERPYKSKNKDFEFTEELLLVRGVTRTLFDKIKDYITVYGEGKVNVNTAPAEVLIAIIPNPEIVNSIIKDRSGPDNVEGTDDDGWKNIQSFTGYLRTRIKNPAGYAKYLTVTSDNFRIISHGSAAGGVGAVITCVVKRKAKESGGGFLYYSEE
jgi:general secretion pathway protein K